VLTERDHSAMATVTVSQSISHSLWTVPCRSVRVCAARSPGQRIITALSAPDWFAASYTHQQICLNGTTRRWRVTGYRHW